MQKSVKVSLTDLLENRVEPNLMLRKVVIVGSIAESLKDRFFTPYSSKLFAPR
jgi:adenylate cyclase